MKEALETFLKDLMSDFKRFGILDPTGAEFNPDNFAPDNLQEFMVDISDKTHSHLPFYDPACDGLNENENMELLRSIQASDGWVDANKHIYAENVGKVLWNNALSIYNMLRLLDMSRFGLAAKIPGLISTMPGMKSKMNEKAAYLDDSPVKTSEELAEEAKAWGIKYYVTPRIVDKRTLAFAESSLKLTRYLLTTPNPFEAELNKLHEKAGTRLDTTIMPILNKVLIGAKITYPELIDRIECYKARLTRYKQSDEERTELFIRVGELKKRATVLLEKFRGHADLIAHIERETETITHDVSPANYEEKLTKIAGFIEAMNETAYFLDPKLPIEYCFKQDYTQELYATKQKHENDLFRRMDTEVTQYYQATLKQLYPNKTLAQIKEDQEKMLEKLQQHLRNLTMIHQSQLSEKENAVALKAQLLNENTQIEEQITEKNAARNVAAQQLDQYDTQNTEIIDQIKKTIAAIQRELEPLLEEQQNEFAAAKERASNQSLPNYLGSTISSLWTSQPDPLEPLNRKVKELQEKLQVEIAKLKDLNTPRIPLTERLSSLTIEIEALELQHHRNREAIAKHQATINEKTKAYEEQIQEHINRLDAEIQNQIQQLNPKNIKNLNMAEFQEKTRASIEAFEKIKADYDASKRANNNVYQSEKLSSLYILFDSKYASHPLTDPNIQQAITLIVADYETRNAHNASRKLGVKIQNRRILKFAQQFLIMSTLFLHNSTIDSKIKALDNFKRFCDKITLPKQTRIAAGVILGVLIGIAVGLCLISGLGVILATGWAAVLTASVIVKIAAAMTLYIFGVLGLTVGFTIGETTTPKVSEVYQKLGFFCNDAFSTLEDQAKKLPEKPQDNRHSEPSIFELDVLQFDAVEPVEYIEDTQSDESIRLE